LFYGRTGRWTARQDIGTATSPSGTPQLPTASKPRRRPATLQGQAPVTDCPTAPAGRRHRRITACSHRRLRRRQFMRTSMCCELSCAMRHDEFDISSSCCSTASLTPATCERYITYTTLCRIFIKDLLYFCIREVYGRWLKYDFLTQSEHAEFD